MFKEKGMVINGGNFEKRMMRLGVRACKSEDEGMNLVFMTYADVCALAGSQVQQDSLCVILEESHIFFVRVSMDLQRGTIGLDSVQRTSMQISLNDRVTVRVWDTPSAVVSMQSVLFSVDLPSYSNRRPTQIDAGDLVKMVRRCFVGNMLHSKQYLLAVADGVRLRLRVVGLETPSINLAIALCMGQHRRLGQRSGLQMLESSHLRRIAELAWGQATAFQNSLFTRDTAVEFRAQPNSPINLRQQARTMFLDRLSQNPAVVTKPRAGFSSSLQGDQNDDATAMQEVTIEGTHTVRGLTLSDDFEGNVIVSSAAESMEDDQQLMPGDIMESINGQSVVGKDAKEIQKLLVGPCGSFVTCGARRGLRRNYFITLERDHPAASTPQYSHRPVVLFSATSAPENKKLQNGSTSSKDTSATNLKNNGSGLLADMTKSPGENQTEDAVVIEDLAKENRRLRSELSAQQIQNKALLRSIEHERKRVTLVEQLAPGLDSQIKVIQGLLRGLYRDIAEQSRHWEVLRQKLRESEKEVARMREESANGGCIDSPKSTERESILRLEEMVETLLTLGEQESGILNTELKRENQDLKYILSQLQLAERMSLGSSFNSPARTSRSATHLSPARGFSVASPERGLSSLSESLHHVMYSSMASPPPRRKAGLYASLSQATASLLSTSPDLVPLAVHTASMSPFVAKAAPASWEETMSRLSLSHASHRKSSTRLPIAVNRDRRHSHSYSPSSSAPHSADKRTWKERWDDAISSYSQIGSDSLVSAREWDTADKYYRSARKDEHSTIVSPNATLNDSTMDRRNTQELKDELNCINGNSRMSDPKNTKTQTDTVLGLETADWERESCTWAANKAGIQESVAGTVHKLLLKGKTLGQIVKNHRIVDLNICEQKVCDYIHYCSNVAINTHGRKPRWVLLYTQEVARRNLGSSNPRMETDSPAPTYALATHLQDVSIIATKPNIPRSSAPTSHGEVMQADAAAAVQRSTAPVSFAAAHVTLCSARHLPHGDGMWETCDSFIELVYKDKTLTSTVKKNSLNPDWDPEDQAKFEFDLSSGELEDIRIHIKDCNRTTKLLGTTVIGVNTLKQLMAGGKAAFPSDEFLITALITAPDGTPLMGRDQQQTHLLLKVAIVKEPYAEQPGGMMIAPDLTKVTPEQEVSQQQEASLRANRRSPSHVPSPETRNPKATRANPLSGNWPPAFSRTAPLPSSGRTASLPQVSESKTSVGMQVSSNNNRAPFFVTSAQSLMDRNHLLQGEKRYLNPIVRPGDQLTHVGGEALQSATMDELRALLQGPSGSAVDLAFSRSGVDAHSFSVNVTRHAQQEKSPTHSPDLSQSLLMRQTQLSSAKSEASSPSTSPAQSIRSSSPSPLSERVRATLNPVYLGKPPPSEVLSNVLSNILGSSPSPTPRKPVGSRPASG